MYTYVNDASMCKSADFPSKFAAGEPIRIAMQENELKYKNKLSNGKF